MTQPLTLSTNDRGEPVATFELQTPQGGKRWVYVYRDDAGAVLLEGAEKAPRWVESSVRYWAASIRRIREDLGLWRDEAKRTKPIVSDLINLSNKALLYGTPQTRKLISKRAAESHRLAQQMGMPLALAELHLEAASKLYEALRRFEPAKRVDNGGPTRETLDKLQDDPAQAIYEAMPPHYHRAVQEITAVWRAITSKLDARAGSLLGGGRGSPQHYEPPIDALTDGLEVAYSERYRPWAQDLGLRRAVPHHPHTWFQVTMAVIVEWYSFEEADQRHRLPNGRAKVIVEEALAKYPVRTER